MLYLDMFNQAALNICFCIKVEFHLKGLSVLTLQAIAQFLLLETFLNKDKQKKHT